MSLEDAKVLAGLAADGAPFFSHAAIGMDVNTDPDATPMPMQMDQGPSGHLSHSQHEQSSRLHKASSHSHVQWSSPVQSFPPPSRERDKDVDTRELRDFWRDYMHTPLSGPGLTDSPGGGMYRRPRVNSLPSKKTPLGGPGGSGEAYGYPGTAISSQGMAGTGMTLGVSHFMPMLLPRRPSTGLGTPLHGSMTTEQGHGQGQQPQTHQVRHGHGSAEDLRSYEAAVLARKAPTNLSLKPRKRRTTEGSSSDKSGSASVGASPIVPSMLPSVFRGGGGPLMKMEEEEENGRGGGVQPRGWGRMDVDTSSSTMLSSLANVFGHTQVGPGWRHSPVSRESSVSVSDGSSGGCGAGEGGASMGSPGDMFRPTFKRLPSQTLEPVNAKRTQLMGPGEGDGDEDNCGREQPPVMTIAQRRRMSSGGGRGTVPASMDLGLGTFEKW